MKNLIYKIIILLVIIPISHYSIASTFETNEDIFEAQSKAQNDISSQFKSLLLKFIISKNTLSLNYASCDYLKNLTSFHQYQVDNIDHHMNAYGNAVIFEDELKLLKLFIEKNKITCGLL